MAARKCGRYNARFFRNSQASASQALTWLPNPKDERGSP
jgi:hypothetical protein